MSDIALTSQGVTIDFGDTGSPPAFANIPEIRSISGPDGQTNWMDTTDLNSAAKEGRPGLKDEGGLRLDIYYVPGNTVHDAMRAAYAAQTLKACRVSIPTSGVTRIYEADIYVTGFAMNFEVDSPQKAQVNFKITGALRQVQ